MVLRCTCKRAREAPLWVSATKRAVGEMHVNIYVSKDRVTEIFATVSDPYLWKLLSCRLCSSSSIINQNKRLFCTVQPAIGANPATTLIFPQRSLFCPENSPYIYTHLYTHNHLVKKGDAAKILSCLV